MTLWWIIAALLLCVVTYIGLSGARLRAAPAETAAQIYGARHAELLQDFAQGSLGAEARTAIETELARNALREVPPQAQHPQRAQGRLLALGALAVILSAVAVPVYLRLGMPALTTGAAPIEVSAGTRPSISEMTAQLQQRIAIAPQDPEPRLWLARLYVSTERYPDAVEQYAAVLKMVGEDPAVLVQYADTLAMINGGRLTGPPAALIQRALQAAPEHPTALWLAGLAAREAGDSAQALAYLQRARIASVAADQPTTDLDEQIAAIAAELPAATNSGTANSGAANSSTANSSTANSAPANSAPANATAAAASPRLTVEVQLDAALAGRIGPNAVLFVLAKQVAGMPMPLAVKRLPAANFPLTVVLDDSLAMSPAARLSSASVVDVVARISQAGQPVAASGDLQGKIANLSVGPDVHIRVNITEVVP
jgi:cytochrome c-type biogenesis protein CcmH